MTAVHRVVMVATSYPRFEGDTVGTFMEPIARGVAARGHEVHLVLPWHPRLERPRVEHGVHFHPFHYAPTRSLHVFGYAGALHEDVRMRGAALAVAPVAVAAGTLHAWRVVRKVRATIVHGHWVVPGGAIAAWAAPGLPLVVSLHGSDVYLAERQSLTRRVAGAVLRRAGAVLACSDDLRVRAIALGAASGRSETIPYGVDVTRFAPDPTARESVRHAAGIGSDEQVVFALGRFVRKKGFEYLIEALGRIAPERPRLRLVLAGGGDLERELRARIERAGLGTRSLLPGVVSHDSVPGWLAAADVVAVPSVRDDAGNVDGLPNVLLEALASGTPVVATRAGGMGAAVRDGETGLLVDERDVAALAAAIERLLADPAIASALGRAARARATAESTWEHVAARIEAAYERASQHAAHR